MRPAEDRRPLVREFVWRHPKLTWREKAYLIRVTELPSEDGRRGSKAMGWDAHFALHLDYIADHLGAHPDTISDAQKGCVAKGFLSLVHPAAYGRPATYQAHRCEQDVADAKKANEAGKGVDRRCVTRGKTRGVTNRQNTPGYENGDPPVARGETPFLTYRGGTQPDHAGSRPSSTPVARGAVGNQQRDHPANVRAAVDHLGSGDARGEWSA